jgi:3-hydroxybutyryl-CoA dehydrogenase
MNYQKVGVIGCGLMGSGIAQTAATAGFETVVVETDERALERGLTAITQSLTKFVEKGVIAPEVKEGAQSRLRGVMDLSHLAECDIVIEAIVENPQVKAETYKRLDEICKPETTFATNTSSLSVTQLASATSVERRRRFVGLHFFSPVPLMQLVEVVRTILTDPAVFEDVTEFGRKLGKVPVQTSDKTGFIVNRLLVPYCLDAIRALEEGVGTIADIDAAMKLGCGYPMGPFTLNDMVGLDVLYYVSQVMFEEFKERRFSAPPLLTRMVAAGLLGRKTGKGFYDYADPKNPKPMNLT